MGVPIYVACLRRESADAIARRGRDSVQCWWHLVIDDSVYRHPDFGFAAAHDEPAVSR
jgi:dihydropyrimidinase